MVGRALDSVRDPDVSHSVWLEVDHHGEGPAAVRNRAVVDSSKHGQAPAWLAFLDDDDEFHPGHLRKCLDHAEATGADVVYPWFDLDRMGKIRNDLDPLRLHGKPVFGQPFDAEALRRGNYIPVTALVRAELFDQVGGFPVPGTEEWPLKDGEDWGLWKRLLAAGAKFSHLPERTWIWHHHGKNTSGRPATAAKIYPRETR
jgi:glycosyltransferase involved in cell wall biosynthesis